MVLPRFVLAGGHFVGHVSSSLYWVVIALVTFTGLLRVTISLRKRHGPLGAKLSRLRNRHSMGTFPVLFCAVARYAFLCV